MKKLNVGIIGAGWQADNHIDGYLKSGQAEIVAIADINEDAAKALMKKYSIKSTYYSDFRELLKDSAVEAVSICAPNKFHSIMTVAAAESGKHILCEKPFVTNIEEAKRSYHAIRDNKIKCAVGYHRRFNPLYQEMRRVRDEGKLGNIFFAQSDYIHNLPDALPIWGWIGKKALNPSLFHAGGGHCVDIIRYMMDDEIVECTAYVSNLNYPSCETEAETVALYRFKNNQIGKVMSLVLKPVASFEFNLEVYGMPNYNDPNNKDNVICYPEWMPDNTKGVTEPWDVEIGEFVKWVLDESSGETLCKAKDAIRVAEACWAAVISSAEHRPVKLPLVELD
jgi:predicted dehydrogenase